MNEIKIYLKPSGSIAELYKDFELYEGCYRNSQLTVFVPKSLLYANEENTFINLIKTGAILTAPNGKKLTTKTYYLDYEREQTIGGVEFSVYTMITPKEFCVYAGTQTVVVNVESVDNTDQTNPTILSATTTQTATLIVQESAYLGQDEPIEPTELEKIKATLTEIQGEVNDLPNKYVTVDTHQIISGNKTHTGINTFNGFTSINGVGIDADAIVKGSDRFKYPVKSGTLALTSDIPENIVTKDENGQIKVPFAPAQDDDAVSKKYVDTAISDTQGQLAQTNQNVEDLYTILEQAQVVTVTTLEQAYTTRETADGENIVDGVQTTVKEIRGKTVKSENLIPYPYTETTKTANGVTFTVNSDGSIMVNGTATANSSFVLVSDLSPIKLDKSESYFLSGCPSGGGFERYRIFIQNTAYQQGYSDVGNGVSFTAEYTDYYIFIIIREGATVNNLVFRPMLNAGTTAKPYSKWFAGLKNAFFKEIVSTGKNLIPYPYYEKSRVINGITYTVNSDGSILLNGTATANSSFVLVSDLSPIKLDKSESYFLSGCPSGGGFERYRIFIQNTAYQQGYSDVGNGVSFTAEYTDYYIFIIIREGATVNNLVFSPMLNHGTSALPYEPYTSDTLSAATPIELAEYDVAYPETGETKRNSGKKVFDGTETWEARGSAGDLYRYGAVLANVKTSGACVANLSGENSGASVAGNYFIDTEFKVFTNIATVDEWKAHLAEIATAGNPLTVIYETAEAITEATPFDKSKYIAWKNGSETIEQGANDNSEYGAENTVKQDYFTLTGGTTNV